MKLAHSHKYGCSAEINIISSGLPRQSLKACRERGWGGAYRNIKVLSSTPFPHIKALSVLKACKANMPVCVCWGRILISESQLRTSYWMDVTWAPVCTCLHPHSDKDESRFPRDGRSCGWSGLHLPREYGHTEEKEAPVQSRTPEQDGDDVSGTLWRQEKDVVRVYVWIHGIHLSQML